MTVLYKGVDISKHNKIDWSQVKKGDFDFVIIRAGYGFKTEDPQFKTNIEAAIKLGLHIGVYWFSYAGTVEHAKREADGCLKVIAPYKQYIDFPVWYDYGYEGHDYAVRTYKVTPTKQSVSDMAIMFMETVKKAGYKVGNYSNIDYLNKFFDDRVKNNYDTWLAHVGINGAARTSTYYKGKYTMWQYSWKGKPTGFSGITVDMNYCYKDYPNEGKTVNKAEDKPVIAPTTKKTYTIPKNITFATDVNKNVITTYSYKSHKDKKLSNHFQVKEFASWKVKNKTLYSDKVKIHNKLIQILEIVYTELDCSKIIINSGYRTSKHDKAVGGSGNGQHTLGRACDFTAYDKNGKIIDAKKICCLLEDMGVWGIGYISPTSVHCDTRAKSKQWWGDETKAGSPNISKLGYKSFHDYFKM